MSDKNEAAGQSCSRSLVMDAGAAPRDHHSTSNSRSSSQQNADVFSFLRRAIDIVVSLAALLFFGPLMLMIALAIRVFDPGPVFYAQPRIGLDGRIFNCFKFRTMVFDADKRLRRLLEIDSIARKEWFRSQKLKKDPRVTRLGRFLRMSSLDELPQFINVLLGEMSIVGPRPIVKDEGKRYGRYLSHYCRMKPGLTGLWQVSGRNNTTYRRRVAMDVYYSRNHSIKLDLWVMLKTPKAVFGKVGVY